MPLAWAWRETIREIEEREHRARVLEGMRFLAWQEAANHSAMLDATWQMRSEAMLRQLERERVAHELKTKKEKEDLKQRLSEMSSRKFWPLPEKDCVYSQMEKLSQYIASSSYEAQQTYKLVVGRIILAAYAHSDFCHSLYGQNRERRIKNIDFLQVALFSAETQPELIQAASLAIQNAYPFSRGNKASRALIGRDVVVDILKCSPQLQIPDEACIRALRFLTDEDEVSFPHKKHVQHTVEDRMKLNGLISKHWKDSYYVDRDDLEGQFKSRLKLAKSIESDMPDGRLKRRALRLLAMPLFDGARNGAQMCDVWHTTGVVPNEAQREAILNRVEEDRRAWLDAEVRAFKRNAIAVPSRHI